MHTQQEAVVPRKLAEQLVHTRIRLCILLQDLCDRHLEILLTHILPSFSECVHACARSSAWATQHGQLRNEEESY